ncbi:hypothetical protein [Arthrobacter sp. H35-D1]|nr:hypothetical protein [Arthrobacter sp. H35-D1]MDJ0313047.1 hypothetical protein [Arthrobacter sp. H35-D1]
MDVMEEVKEDELRNDPYPEDAIQFRIPVLHASWMQAVERTTVGLA